MNIIFDLRHFSIKMFISVVFFIIFLIIYKLIPGEFGYNDISNFDLIYNALLNHIGINHSKVIKPNTIRAKITIISHLIVSYSILLM